MPPCRQDAEGNLQIAVREKGYLFCIDGAETGRWPENIPISNHPEYLILSCESEKWAGDISKANLPDVFTVDYIRVWQTPAQVKADFQRPDKKRERPDFP